MKIKHGIDISTPRITTKLGMQSSTTEADIDTEGTEFDDEDFDYTKGMPDRKQFKEFYDSIVPSGSEMVLENFIKYPDVKRLLEEGLIYYDDVYSLWISAVGDAAGIDADEAYEMLCMVSDLPDPEDIEFLNTEFKKLENPSGQVTLTSFLSWGDIQDMINEKVLTKEQVEQLWVDLVGDTQKAIDRIQFGVLNQKVDEKVEENEELESSAATITKGLEKKVNKNSDLVDKEDKGNKEEDLVDLTGVNVWDSSFDPASVFEEDMYNEVSAYYRKKAVSGGLSLAALMEWEDIQEMLADESLSEQDIKGIWAEAPKNFKGLVDFDTFIRLNVRLDMVIQENENREQAASTRPPSSPASPPPPSSLSNEGSSYADEDLEQFYRSEFQKISGGGRLIRFDMLLRWTDVKDLIDEGALTEKQVKFIFDRMPQEPMGIPATEFGISEDTFVSFNALLDQVLDSGEDVNQSILDRIPVPTSSLTSEKALPLPKDAELKIGSLGGSVEGADDNEVGLSESEKQLMEVLDKADNMLNSGSFGDFDQLIGDVNDPRLQALRDQQQEQQEKVRGEIDEVLSELVSLAGRQSRCGMDLSPDTEEGIRLRTLVSAVLERSPKQADQQLGAIKDKLSGNWTLLYTNSEMFSFYNGITGLVNVYPSSRFESLSVSISPGSYLNEAKYLERIKTPLGVVDAAVFANWDLMKEMSFMTNENSVVLRTYCTRVTAGPFEYQAEENWKSLRTVSMNEVVYVDDRVLIMRNSGALRIFFLFVKS